MKRYFYGLEVRVAQTFTTDKHGRSLKKNSIYDV